MQRAHLSLWLVIKKKKRVCVFLIPLVFLLTQVALQADSLPHRYVWEYWGDKQNCCLALHFENNFFCLIWRLKIAHVCFSFWKNMLEHREKFLSCGASGLQTLLFSEHTPQPTFFSGVGSIWARGCCSFGLAPVPCISGWSITMSMRSQRPGITGMCWFLYGKMLGCQAGCSALKNAEQLWAVSG